MVNNTTRKQSQEEVELQMTPMIDVTFLLLIFFLCSIKFKWLDGKLCTYLPRDKGVNRTPEQMDMEQIKLYLYRAPDSPLGFDIYWHKNKLSGLKALGQQMAEFCGKDPTLRATCYPGEGIQYHQVVKVVNECLRAECDHISFGAVREDE